MGDGFFHLCHGLGIAAFEVFGGNPVKRGEAMVVLVEQLGLVQRKVALRLSILTHEHVAHKLPAPFFQLLASAE